MRFMKDTLRIIRYIVILISYYKSYFLKDFGRVPRACPWVNAEIISCQKYLIGIGHTLENIKKSKY